MRSPIVVQAPRPALFDAELKHIATAKLLAKRKKEGKKAAAAEKKRLKSEAKGQKGEEKAALQTATTSAEAGDDTE